jgi:hypothetical protein
VAGYLLSGYPKRNLFPQAAAVDEADRPVLFATIDVGLSPLLSGITSSFGDTTYLF